MAKIVIQFRPNFQGEVEVKLEHIFSPSLVRRSASNEAFSHRLQPKHFCT